MDRIQTAQGCRRSGGGALEHEVIKGRIAAQPGLYGKVVVAGSPGLADSVGVQRTFHLLMYAFLIALPPLGLLFLRSFREQRGTPAS